MKDYEKRIDAILKRLLEYTLMDFSKEIPFSEERDELDAIAVGINSMGQELSHTLQELQHKNQELQEKQRLTEQRNKELEQIALVTAHDLREPLVLINSFCEKLDKEFRSELDEAGQLYIKYITDSSSRMNQLLEGLMEYYQIGRETPSEMVNLNELVKDIIDNAHEEISHVNARIEVDELPSVKAVPHEMDLLFSHLLSNALKFRNEKNTPSIQLTVQSLPEKWQLCFSDNGIGIEKQYQEKAFQMFRTLNPNRHYHGQGLGLAYCKKIVQRYGGEIWFESSIGKGSRFYFTIPKHEHE